MREPVLQDKRQEHLKFCKYGMALIERVSGKQQNSNMDVSLERLRKVCTQFCNWNSCVLAMVYLHIVRQMCRIFFRLILLRKQRLFIKRKNYCI